MRVARHRATEYLTYPSYLAYPTYGWLLLRPAQLKPNRHPPPGHVHARDFAIPVVQQVTATHEDLARSERAGHAQTDQCVPLAVEAVAVIDRRPDAHTRREADCRGATCGVARVLEHVLGERRQRRSVDVQAAVVHAGEAGLPAIRDREIDPPRSHIADVGRAPAVGAAGANPVDDVGVPAHEWRGGRRPAAAIHLQAAVKRPSMFGHQIR